MIRRTTWILLIIFAGLAAMIWLVPMWQERNPLPTPTVMVTPSLLFEEGTINWMTLQSSDGNVVVVEKTAGASQWTVKQPSDLIFEPTQVQSAMMALEGMNVQTALAQQPPQDAMGLDNPAYMITLMLKDGAERIVKVGKATPTGSGYYAQVGSQPAFVAGKAAIDPVVKLLSAGVSPVTPSAGTSLPGTPGTSEAGSLTPAP